MTVADAIPTYDRRVAASGRFEREGSAVTGPPALLSRPLVPVASEDDAIETCRAAFPRVAVAGGHPLVVHVIEKAGGAPDKASVEQREEAAEGAFDAVRDCAAEHGLDVETGIRYGTDVAETVVAAAADAGASAIVFRSRGGSRLLDYLTGNVRDGLLHGSDRPVVVVPDVADAEDDR